MAGVQATHAQIFGATSNSPRSLALGRSDIADSRDEWSPNAALPADTFSHIHALLSPLPLGLPQSWNAGFSGDIPFESHWLAGASFSRYQYTDAFSWQSFGIQASKTFDVGTKNDTTQQPMRHAVAGIRLRYSQETFGDASSVASYLPLDDIGVDLGASFDLFPQLTFAAAVTHLVSLYNNQDISSEDRVAWLGLSYRPTTDLTLDATLETSPENNPAFHAGAEYAIDQHLFVRAGADTQTGEISGGIGVHSNNFTADFAAIRHPDLGTSISFGIGFEL